MKYILASVLLMSLATPAFGTPSLVGKWQSDRELTMEFIKENVRLEDKTYRFLGDMMGRLTLTFTAEEVRFSLPDWDVMIEGEERHMVGFSNETSYTVLYVNEHVIVVTGAEPVTGREIVTTYNFDSPDLMWIYTGGAGNALPNSHYREYFRRVPQP